MGEVALAWLSGSLECIRDRSGAPTSSYVQRLSYCNRIKFFIIDRISKGKNMFHINSAKIPASNIH